MSYCFLVVLSAAICGSAPSDHLSAKHARHPPAILGFSLGAQSSVLPDTWPSGVTYVSLLKRWCLSRLRSHRAVCGWPFPAPWIQTTSSISCLAVFGCTSFVAPLTAHCPCWPVGQRLDEVVASSLSSVIVASWQEVNIQNEVTLVFQSLFFMVAQYLGLNTILHSFLLISDSRPACSALSWTSFPLFHLVSFLFFNQILTVLEWLFAFYLFTETQSEWQQKQWVYSLCPCRGTHSWHHSDVVEHMLPPLVVLGFVHVSVLAGTHDTGSSFRVCLLQWILGFSRGWWSLIPFYTSVLLANISIYSSNPEFLNSGTVDIF